jgi:hypothetical protein
MRRNKKASSSSFPWKEFLTFLGVIIAAYFGYLGMRSQAEIPIKATQTAEAKQTAAAQLFGITPSSNSIDTTPTIETITVSQITETPSNYADPKMFVQDYFVLLNQQRYQEAWSKLSNQFKENFANKGAGGYEEYVSFWKSVDEVKINAMEIESQSNTQALIHAEINYQYKAGYTATGHTTYKLVKNSSNASWLFDPN